MSQQLLDARLVLVLAVVTGVLATVLSLRASRKSKLRLARTRAWPTLVDSIVSALNAGSTIYDALMMACAKAPAPLLNLASEFARNLEAKGSKLALRQLAITADNAAADEFAVLLQINHKLGGAGLAELLTNHSLRARRRNGQQLILATKVSATLAMARLGVCAPWVLLALLLSRPESANSFNSAAGVTLLLGGLAVSVLAYRLTSLLGRNEEVLRVYSPYAKA